uniref:Uncharacterized protein n=1 Tax=viral metagenome TaxID=1070528 RepID=A0A6C0E9B7_9ZZZZ
MSDSCVDQWFWGVTSQKNIRNLYFKTLEQMKKVLGRDIFKNNKVKILEYSSCN